MLKDCAVPTVPLWTVAILPADRKMFCVVSHFTRFVPCELVPLAISFSAEHHIRTQPNLSKQRKSARKGAASRRGSTTSPWYKSDRQFRRGAPAKSGKVVTPRYARPRGRSHNTSSALTCSPHLEGSASSRSPPRRDQRGRRATHASDPPTHTSHRPRSWPGLPACPPLPSSTLHRQPAGVAFLPPTRPQGQTHRGPCRPR